MIKRLIDWYCHEPILWDELGDKINAQLFCKIKENGQLPKNFIDKYLECDGFHDWGLERISIEEGKRRSIRIDLFHEYADDNRDQVSLVFHDFFNLTIQKAFHKHHRKFVRTELLAILFEYTYPNMEIGICFSDNSAMIFSIPKNNLDVLVYNVTHHDE